MQSMLWLHILIVLQISMLNFVHSESTHPNVHFKWWRKRHSNAHKHLIDEMSPGQFSHLQEEYNDIKIPVRHEKFSKLNQVMCNRLGNCSTSSVKKDVERREVDTTSQKIHDHEIESKLHHTQKHKHERHDPTFEGPVVEDLNDFSAAQANRSHWEIERKKQNADELSPMSKRKMELAGNPTILHKRFQELYSTELPVIANIEEGTRFSRLAESHLNQMFEETRCQTPKPIIVRVSDIYPHPHKFYMPQCTKLFQCTEKSGCCTEPRRCATHKTENVTLYFKVHTQIQGKGEVITVEALTFQNDTECTCKKPTPPSPVKHESDWESLQREPQDESRSECICPAPYSKRTMSDGTCICDCFYDDIPCLSHKNGETKMKWSEIRCVREGKCTKPTCERGVYSAKSGKCPISPRYKWQT